ERRTFSAKPDRPTRQQACRTKNDDIFSDLLEVDRQSGSQELVLAADTFRGRRVEPVLVAERECEPAVQDRAQLRLGVDVVVAELVVHRLVERGVLDLPPLTHPL